MKKFAFLTVMFTGFLALSVGCSKENTVIEAPADATEEDDAMDGMTDEEYDAAMDADMEG